MRNQRLEHRSDRLSKAHSHKQSQIQKLRYTATEADLVIHTSYRVSSAIRCALEGDKDRGDTHVWLLVLVADLSSTCQLDDPICLFPMVALDGTDICETEARS